MVNRIQRWLGWMLKVNRVAGPDPGLRTRTAFARVLPDQVVRPVHPSTIQRWEAGSLRAPRGAITRYERLLALPTGTLTSIFDLLEQLGRTPLTVPARNTALPAGRINQLLELACSPDEVISGAEWDELTGLLDARPMAFLPQPLWEAIAERLLVEMLIACGTPWNLRYAAFNRLVVHPSGQEAVIDVCAATAALPDHQVMTSTVAALGASDHAYAITVLLRQLAEPTNDKALTGAVIALAAAADRGRLEAYDQARADAALQAFRSPARPFVQPDDRRTAMVNGIAARTSAVDESGTGELDVLSELVDGLLFDADSEIRVAAAALLAATPYKRSLAAALRAELMKPSTLTGDPEWSSTLLAALRYVGGEPELRLSQLMVTADGLPAETVRVAAFAIAHLDGKAPDSWWNHAIEKHLRQAARRESAEILSGLAYSAGITGHLPTLERLRLDARAPHEAQTAASWWLNLPSQITAGAQT
ncbi:hypothetical protein PWY87_28055 [Kribbella solani]|uniref:hypothetical protein n=1 Tax=Kribbella solani TaxID=236067 RepID=UPI0029A54E89|nr:hypothetical protein [Kribbella solani]MDX2971302.1 hypothetical protein [Kribbella solani]MDX3005565.1 hypothetical protein [Kribbella solani]